MAKFLTSIFGSRNDRLLKQYRKTVARINALEPEFEKLSDEALRGKTQEFKDRLAQGQTLDDLLPEAFAVVREASKRVLKMRHFDVQMMGGIGLHEGKIAEMRTGEGKTLTSTLPVYLNALTGKGVHIVTVNDYLAARDAETMRPLYNFLGMSVGVNLPQAAAEEKTIGGIIIPDTAKEKPLQGKVVATGNGTKDEEMVVKEGDTVLYGKYAGTELEYDGKKYLVMRQSDILAILG